jgi:hypothetical protein
MIAGDKTMNATPVGVFPDFVATISHAGRPDIFAMCPPHGGLRMVVGGCVVDKGMEG